MICYLWGAFFWVGRWGENYLGEKNMVVVNFGKGVVIIEGSELYMGIVGRWRKNLYWNL